jgi:Probable cobalt transporter subunit (CbtB)
MAWTKTVFVRRDAPASRKPDSTFAPDARPVSIPVGELLPWAIFAGLILLLAIYFVGAEEGATSLTSGMYVHEFVHDGRHLLSFPCH